MAILKKIGELPNLSSQLVAMNGNNAVGVIALENEAYTANMSDIMEGIGKIAEFDTLDTGNQTIIGAINEIYAFMHNYVVFCTQAEYDALTTYENKLYLITDGSAMDVEGFMYNSIENLELPGILYIPAHKFYGDTNDPDEVEGSIKTCYAPDVTFIGAAAFNGYSTHCLRKLIVGDEPSATREKIVLSGTILYTDSSHSPGNFVKFGFKNENYIGITTTAITEHATTNPIVINNESVTVEQYDVVYTNDTILPYRWTGTEWEYYPPVETLQMRSNLSGTSVNFLNFKIIDKQPNMYLAGASGMANLVCVDSDGGQTRTGTVSFSGCSSLQRINFSSNAYTLVTSNMFNGCTNLKILKLPYSGVVAIGTVSGGTPTYSSKINLTKIGQGTADAKVYVPSAQIENYKVDTCWAPFYTAAMANGNQLFYPLD